LKDIQSENFGISTKHLTAPKGLGKLDKNYKTNNNHIFSRVKSPSDIKMNEFLDPKNNLVVKRPYNLSKSEFYNQGSVPFKVTKSCRPNLNQINIQKRNFNFSMTNLRGPHLNLWNDVQQRIIEKNQNLFISSRNHDELNNLLEINTYARNNFKKHSLPENIN